ncbi:hypothetical protein CGCTS75_v000479 [Colletotrichum tropicale]|nr:hypothetical protein CGCTS75_v000479 [Colletotrichum tropicale]
MVRILLKDGCPVNEQGARKLSPLSEAISKDLEGIVRQLVDAGTELRPEHIVSAKSGNCPDIKRLVLGYLKVHVHEWPDQWLERMPEVIEHGDVDEVQLLLDHGAKYSFEHIVLAVRVGKPAVRTLFLELVHNYVAEFPNHTREWLLYLKEENDHDTLQALRDHGASQHDEVVFLRLRSQDIEC